jgi:hypothetical protein
MGRKLSPENVVVEGGALAGESLRSRLTPEARRAPSTVGRALCVPFGRSLGGESCVQMDRAGMYRLMPP